MQAQSLQGIILAGGLGTRLREAVPDLPKCMAPVAEKPFLFYVINALRMQGVNDFIFSLGFKHEIVATYLKENFSTLRYQVIVENEPLGTGGAIQLACQNAHAENVLVVNGDSIFNIDLNTVLDLHLSKNAGCTLALKLMHNFDRYGVVELSDTGKILSFKEKQYYNQGIINAGIYLINRSRFLSNEFPKKFSFEKEYLEPNKNDLFGCVAEGYFIDIGIPEDFKRAQIEMAGPALQLSKIDKTWTLFLDRDGVINKDKEGSYIFSTDEFIFDEGAPALFKKLSEKFGRIIIITNQRGVGRGLMTEDALTAIHEKMKAAIAQAGGKIDSIYYCTSVENNHPNRKPNPGMAVLAKNDFPSIDFSRSIMVGNNPGDMGFGKNAGMHTVFLKTTKPNFPLPHPAIDLAFNSLNEFTKAL